MDFDPRDYDTRDEKRSEVIRPRLRWPPAGIALSLRHQPGYDNSYYFISTFMPDHVAWHAERL